MKHRGMGRVFRPTIVRPGGIREKCSTWFIEFWVNGTRHREKTGSTKEQDAVKLLKLRTGEAAIGKVLPGDVAKTTFEDLCALVRQDYEKNGQRLVDLNVSLKRLAGAFAGFKANEITATRINAYQTGQRRDGYANASINRDISSLHRAFKLAMDLGQVAAIPGMTKLEENNARQGFFEVGDLKKLLKHLPADLHPVFKVAYITGWRVPSELLTREWRHVDFTHGVLRLDPGETKNGKGREFYFTSELKNILEGQRRKATRLERQGKNFTHVFFYDDGSPILSYRRAWDDAVEGSKIERIPHDFRRTAVRNLIRAGVSETIAMRMTGHLTRSVFDRYAISDEGMMLDAAKKLSAFLKRSA